MSVPSLKRISNISDLHNAGLLPEGDAKSYEDLAAQYDIGITDHIHGLLRQENSDVIARQYVPTIAELAIAPDEESDPIGDEVYTPVRGIVHRYPDRVLLKASNVCAVYCRYCFRREMIGAGSDHLSDDDFASAIDYIKMHSEIWEVILTGGDPMILSARRLQKIIDALNEVVHVQVIRIHTRIPVANPSKIDNTILSVLKTSSKAIHVVLHVNHSQEITKQVEARILDLRHANCSVLSQSVLLKGVNDDASVLEALFKKLITLHVRPYYLHHMDRARGTSHFRVSLKKGKKIMKDLQGRVSGICLPKYMLDIPGGHGKIPIYDGYVHALDHDVYRVEDYQGCEHLYFDAVKTEDDV